MTCEHRSISDLLSHPDDWWTILAELTPDELDRMESATILYDDAVGLTAVHEDDEVARARATLRTINPDYRLGEINTEDEVAFMVPECGIAATACEAYLDAVITFEALIGLVPGVRHDANALAHMRVSSYRVPFFTATIDPGAGRTPFEFLGHRGVMRNFELEAD